MSGAPAPPDALPTNRSYSATATRTTRGETSTARIRPARITRLTVEVLHRSLSAVSATVRNESSIMVID